MARVRSRDTTPELLVRRVLTELGFRYRLHRAELPGKPDISFIGRRRAIFVHGCFWHGHECKRGARLPKTNSEYWSKKIARNRLRDADNLSHLNSMGWRVLTLYECELRDVAGVKTRVLSFLNAP